MNIYSVVLISLFLVFMQNASAKIYKWVDDKGRVQFSDRPSTTINDNSTNKIRTPLKKEWIIKRPVSMFFRVQEAMLR